MAVGIASSQLNAWLDALCRSVAYSDPAAFCAKLHTGDPGSAGTSNAATETTRQTLTCSAASGASITTSADAVWTSYPAAETISHVSFWSATSAGTFLGSCALASSKAMAIGETLTLAAGSLTLSVAPVAA